MLGNIFSCRFGEGNVDRGLSNVQYFPKNKSANARKSENFKEIL